MPISTQAITLTFPNPLNVSIQVGDTVYYTNNGTDTVEIGVVTVIGAVAPNGSQVITAQIPVNVTPPVNTSFIFFTKDAQGNTSNLKGYYAEAQFRNDSTIEAELFSVGSEIFESSK